MDSKDLRIERIRTKMNEWGLSARDLAKKAGISESGVSRILSGEIEPRLKTFIKIADALHVDYVWLMGYEDKQENTTASEVTVLFDRLTPSEKTDVERYIKYLISIRGGDQE